ncbi:uncharacterized protein BO95DRAFT_446489, partial [Aspergillus brunneoviolaceus CBS 621.78]
MAGAGRGSKRRSDAKTLSACGFLVSVIGGGACKILPGWAGYSWIHSSKFIASKRRSHLVFREGGSALLNRISL